MNYKPSKKEIKQLDNLNKGYQLIKDGLKLIKNSLPKKDGDVEMQAYKMSKNFDKIIKRIHTLLEIQYVNTQFIEIINTKSDKKKGGRFGKNGNKKG